MLVQYCSVLLNMSYETRTSIFPDPFQDPLKPRPIPIPIYRQFGLPISNITVVPSQGCELPVPQPWGFFLGLIVSRTRFNNLWVDFLAIIFMYYFFIYFYSISYELDMGLNTKEAVSKTISEINHEVGDSVIQSFAEIEENKNGDYHSSYDEIVAKSKKTNYYEAQKYIDKIKSKMILAKFYDGVSTTI